MGFFSWLPDKQLPRIPVAADHAPNELQPFEQSLLSAANRVLGLNASNQYSYRIRTGAGPAAFDDLIGAASLVVADISRVISQCEYEKHFLHPTVRSPEDAVSAACFIATCLFSIAELLHGRDVPFDLTQAYTRAGSALLQLYDPKDQFSILKSGEDLFKHLIDSLPKHPNLKEWYDSLSSLTLVYILSPDAHTREQVYLPAIRQLYLSLCKVWDKRTPVVGPLPPSHQ